MNIFSTLCAYITAGAFLVAAEASTASASACPADTGITVQVLGSGGPIADDARASSAYLLWIDGRSRALIDAGGGAFLRFGEAGAKFADLDFVGLSHYHADHSADLPTVLKTGFFSKRERDLRLAGPAGNRRFPGLSAFLQSLFDSEHGAYAYLSGYLDGAGGLTKLVTREVPLDTGRVHTVYEKDNKGLTIDALSVPHGIVPSISYRVSVDNRTIVFAADQTGDGEHFADFAMNADLLIMHMAIPEDARASAASLHARPSQIGVVASQTAPERLVISHLMARSLHNIESNLREVSERFDGKIDVATDLDCYSLERTH